jgi:hypothetical protein
MEATTIILICLCAPSALLITFFVCYELYSRNIKIFRMAVALILTIVSLIIALIREQTVRRYKEAIKEIE